MIAQSLPFAQVGMTPSLSWLKPAEQPFYNYQSVSSQKRDSLASIDEIRQSQLLSDKVGGIECQRLPIPLTLEFLQPGVEGKIIGSKQHVDQC
jgi:hypothetical protein